MDPPPDEHKTNMAVNESDELENPLGKEVTRLGQTLSEVAVPDWRYTAHPCTADRSSGMKIFYTN